MYRRCGRTEHDCDSIIPASEIKVLYIVYSEAGLSVELDTAPLNKSESIRIFKYRTVSF